MESSSSSSSSWLGLIPEGIPKSLYIMGLVLCIIIIIIMTYNLYEFHIIHDVFFTFFRGSPVSLTFNPSSHVYHDVASKCGLLHGRYMATPWLSSPYFQTAFLNFYWRPPRVDYKRELFRASDGGTFALDWLKSYDVPGISAFENGYTPIVIVIHGLTSDSSAAYLKHLAFSTVKQEWNVVVCSYQGIGGVSVTSDCFYNAGWTKEIRDVINHLHQQNPKATLFAVGTGIGANVLVKYLGEYGEDIPIAGAVAICTPWDLLIESRSISRRTVQKLYDRALTIPLQEYAQLHRTRYSRLADRHGIVKSRTIQDSDNYATRLGGKFETVDTHHRYWSSAQYVTKVAIPLLCISALDDPFCAWKAIPWDECRANKNIVLAVTQHGGHLAFFEGLAGSRLWWVRAVNEFLLVLHGSSSMHTQKKNPQHSGLESSVDQGLYENVSDGLVGAISNDPLSSDVGADPSKKQRDFYIPIISTLSLLGLALHFLFRKKFKKEEKHRLGVTCCSDLPYA